MFEDKYLEKLKEFSHEYVENVRQYRLLKDIPEILENTKEIFGVNDKNLFGCHYEKDLAFLMADQILIEQKETQTNTLDANKIKPKGLK